MPDIRTLPWPKIYHGAKLTSAGVAMDKIPVTIPREVSDLLWEMANNSKAPLTASDIIRTALANYLLAQGHTLDTAPVSKKATYRPRTK